MYDQSVKKYNMKQKKAQQVLAKKVKMIKDQLGLKSISAEYTTAI